MFSSLIEIFEDESFVDKIKRRLPYLFQIAELESSQAGKSRMEVGLVCERVIVALIRKWTSGYFSNKNSSNKTLQMISIPLCFISTGEIDH